MAEQVAQRLDVPFSVAGVLFVIVVIGDGLTSSTSAWKAAWNVGGWVLWSLFVCEFVLRMVIAPSTKTFLRKNWWQVAFLAVPFLRFLRAFTRSARIARAMSSSVRGARSATRTLTARVANLVGLTVGVIVAGTQLLYEFGPSTSYADALHDTTLASVAGEPIDADSPLPDVLEIALAVYATVFFAALAGSFGAFLINRAAAEGVESSLRVDAENRAE
ncbi:MAG TPA: hypothetical protein VM282_01755 [Acidimicrobiales bacterium]|nr:hypothetical protein [Acidimicrobiales bacterium]